MKQAIEAAFNEIQQKQQTGEVVDPTAPRFDVTLPGIGRGSAGCIRSQTIDELKDIMGRLGFSIAEGPEIEDERHNFEALNIPPNIPRGSARQLLSAWPKRRSHRRTELNDDEQSDVACGRCCSAARPARCRFGHGNVQPPVRIISLGRVYRPDKPTPRTSRCSIRWKACWSTRA